MSGMGCRMGRMSGGELCGVVWCGVVCVVWCGVVWCGVCCVVWWSGVERSGVEWNGIRMSGMGKRMK